MARKSVSLSVGRGEKQPVSKGAGLTAKGRAKYNRATGSNLKAPQPEGGAGRGVQEVTRRCRRSACASCAWLNGLATWPSMPASNAASMAVCGSSCPRTAISTSVPSSGRARRTSARPNPNRAMRSSLPPGWRHSTTLRPRCAQIPDSDAGASVGATVRTRRAVWGAQPTDARKAGRSQGNLAYAPLNTSRRKKPVSNYFRLLSYA